MKSIMMIAESIEGILDRRKTETRRIIKPQPIIDAQSGYVFTGNHQNLYKNDVFHHPWQERFAENSRLQPGDVVYVKETYRYLDFLGQDNGYVYQASENGRAWQESDEGFKWNSPLFMPEAAARIFLQVTGVSVERVSEISQEGAQREGMLPCAHRCPGWQNELHSFRDCYRCAYRRAWIKLHNKPKPVFLKGKQIGFVCYPFDAESAEGFGKTYKDLPLNVIVDPFIYVITFKIYETKDIQ